MPDHDPMCLAQERPLVPRPRFCDCERVVRIRSDERERQVMLDRAYRDLAVNEYRKHLLEQVKALDSWEPIGTRLIVRDEVIALLGGEPDA